MPFTRIKGTNDFKSPSGRKFSLKQVKLYYATNGFDKKLLNARKHKRISMEKGELVKEHSHLVKVLKKGDKKELKKEARKQGKELKGYKKHKIITNNKMRRDLGRVDMETGKIEINRKAHKTKKSLINTIEHEKLHLKHPTMSEKKISKIAGAKTRRIYRKMR